MKIDKLTITSNIYEYTPDVCDLEIGFECGYCEEYVSADLNVEECKKLILYIQSHINKIKELKT